MEYIQKKEEKSQSNSLEKWLAVVWLVELWPHPPLGTRHYLTIGGSTQWVSKFPGSFLDHGFNKTTHLEMFPRKYFTCPAFRRFSPPFFLMVACVKHTSSDNLLDILIEWQWSSLTYNIGTTPSFTISTRAEIVQLLVLLLFNNSSFPTQILGSFVAYAWKVCNVTSNHVA